MCIHIESKLSAGALTGVPLRYDAHSLGQIGRLASRVVVGVDHIPTRWLVQRQNSAWLGVGATTHWSAMASAHELELACAQCLHPRDDPNDGLIPTAPFVSFWAGLLVAARLLRHLAGESVVAKEQQTYLTALRPEGIWQSAVRRLPECPNCTQRTSDIRGGAVSMS